MSVEREDIRAEPKTTKDEAYLLGLVEQLRKATSNDARKLAAVRLREAVDALYEESADHFQNVDSVRNIRAIASMNARLQELLGSTRREDRLAVIAANRSIIHGSSEPMSLRVIRATNAFRILFSKVYDMETIRAAAGMVAELSAMNNQFCDATVKFVFEKALDHIMHQTGHHGSKSPMRDHSVLAVSAMVLAELSVHAPSLVFRERANIRAALWQVVLDSSRIVREQGVSAFQGLLHNIIDHSENQDSHSVLLEVLQNIITLLRQEHRGSGTPVLQFSESVQPLQVQACEVHGVLMLISSLIRSLKTREWVHSHFVELCKLIIPLQGCVDGNVREAVACVLPDLVKLDKHLFISEKYLDLVHNATMRLGKMTEIPPLGMGRILEALGEIAKEVGYEAYAPFLEEALTLCDSFLDDFESRGESIPTASVLRTLTDLAASSRKSLILERKMCSGTLAKVFACEFTETLVQTVCEIQRAVPMLREYIEIRLVDIVATTLRHGILNPKSTSLEESLKMENSSTPLSQGVMNSIAIPNASSAISKAYNNIGNLMKDRSRDARDAQLFRQIPSSLSMHSIESHLPGSNSSSYENTNQLLRNFNVGTHCSLSLDGGSVDQDVDDIDLELALQFDRAHSPCVALKTIIHYKIASMQTSDITLFANDFVMPYLKNDNVKVRLLSVWAVSTLAREATKAWLGIRSCSRRLCSDIERIISQLVILAVADPSPDVRLVALLALDSDDLYPYVREPDFLRKIFLCFHDESIAVRKQAVSLAGCLSAKNPAYVLPALRKFLIYLLRVLRFEGAWLATSREEATQLLQILIRSAGRLVEPYTTSLMDVLLARLREASRTNDKAGAAPVLLALGDLGGIISRVNLRPYWEELVPLIVTYILDDDSADAEFCKVALHSFYRLVQSTGFVIQPYNADPRLLPGLLQRLKNETDPDVRRHIEVLLGCLGAVDPTDHKYASLPSLGGSAHNIPRLAASGSQYRPVQLGDGSISSSLARSPTAKFQKTHAIPDAIGDFEARTNNSDTGRHRSPKRDFRGTAFEGTLSLSLLGAGPKRLAAVAEGYIPIWGRSELKITSLVGQLDHPFTANDDYFPSVALDNLVSIVRNATRKNQHRSAFHSIVKILQITKSRAGHFLHTVVPSMLWVLRPCVTVSSKPLIFSSFQDFVMGRLADIIVMAGPNFSPFAFDTILLILRYLQDTRYAPKCVLACCRLLARLRIAIAEHFGPVLGTILSPLLAAVHHGESNAGGNTEAVLAVLHYFGELLEDHAAIVFRTVISIVERSRNHNLQQAALQTIIFLLNRVKIDEITSMVVHPLMRLLISEDGKDLEMDNDEFKSYDQENSSVSSQQQNGSCESSLADKAASAIAIVGNRSSSSFSVFVPTVARALKAARASKSLGIGGRQLEHILLTKNRAVVCTILGVSADRAQYNLTKYALELYLNADDRSSVGSASAILFPSITDNTAPTNSEISSEHASLTADQGRSVPRVHIDQLQFMEMWQVRENYTEDDWIRWRKQLEIGLIKQAGSAALRACGFLVDTYPILARSLFNAAFLSCWTLKAPEGVTEEGRAEIVEILVKGMNSSKMPMDITQTLLNLCEYMDHDERSLPVQIPFLSYTAVRCGAFAKALRYKEQEYSISLRGNSSHGPQNALIGDEGLLSIYEKLGHDESARGTRRHFREQTGSALNELLVDSPNLVDVSSEALDSWAEKLSKWDELLEQSNTDSSAHDLGQSLFSGLRDEPDASQRFDLIVKKLRSLNDLGKWRSTNELLRWAWDESAGHRKVREMLAVDGKGLSVAFDLASWEEFDERVDYVSEDLFSCSFYRTLHLIRKGKEDPSQLDAAEKSLQEAISQLDVHLIARLSEGYPRAYLEVVNSQILVELGEMIDFLRLPPSTREYSKRRLQAMWDQRLNGCKYDRYTWYRLLMIRALVLPPLESKNRWLEFAAMCRKNNRLPMASEALRMLISPSKGFGHSGANMSSDMSYQNAIRLEKLPIDSLRKIPDLEIRFAVLKHLWASGREFDAYLVLKDCAQEYKQAVWGFAEKDRVSSNSALPSVTFTHHVKQKEAVIAAEVFLKLAKWSSRLANRNIPVHGGSLLKTAIDFAEQATKIRPNWYKAWHFWAVLNASYAEKLIEFGRSSRQDSSSLLQENSPRASRSSGNSSGTLGSSSRSDALRKGPTLSLEGKQYLSLAVRGYFTAIKYGGKTRLEDTLKVLTLWFKYGGVANMHLEFDRGFEDTIIAMWLEVVPQIIARLHTSYRNVQAGIEHLLTRIGYEHPQMAVYSLTVAKTTPGPRQQASERVLENIKRQHYKIVTQAEMVAHELVRVAVLWGELWYERLEDCSRLYFGDRNIDAFLLSVLPLHETIARDPETQYEKMFLDDFGAELDRAFQLCRKIAEDRRKGRPFEDIEAQALQVWERYLTMFGRLQKQQQDVDFLDLSIVSDQLKEARDLELAVPGTYNPSVREVVSIQSFSSHLTIIPSKQKPRKLSILGSDGRKYDFLLKGHEDLRQDERVMQVFGLINKLLATSEDRSIRQGVDLKRYAVVALSNNAGLIEWVPNCDTMHTLVREYRAARRVMPNIEHKVMNRIAPEPERLPLLHRVDIFEFMLENTSGADIARVLWLKSRSSEVWLDRRTTFARSLASSSMVGYILGLGDRHPSNLMIDRTTGKMMHIDFGDCFEVALARDKYPEKVPFRLTRMLINALEPCGVDGYFRQTCEAVMRVLRERNTREPLMSMMEAFVHDPLLRMRLVGGQELQMMKASVQRDRVAGQAAMDEMRREQAPPLISDSLRAAERIPPPSRELATLMQTGSLEASFRQRALELSASAEIVPGSIPTGVVPSLSEQIDPALMQSPSVQSRQERDRLLSELPQDKCVELADRRAALALQRVKDKLFGLDFGTESPLCVEEQVQRLIEEARSVENLCSLFIGWCAFW